MRRTVFTSLALLLAASSGFGLWNAWVFRSTKPAPAPDVVSAGLIQPVTLDTREDGLAVIQAADRLDAVHALGFAHARDRFWSMDLDRRRAAGRLAELLGERAVPLDKAARLHDFTRVAAATLARLEPEQASLLRAYTEGVNASLAAQGGTTWAHRWLGAEAEPWREIDCILILNTMFLEQQGDAWLAEARGAEIRDRLGLPWVAPFMARDGASVGALPGPRVLDIPRLPVPENAEPVTLRQEAADLLAASSPFRPVEGRLGREGEALTTEWLVAPHSPSPFYPCEVRYTHGTETVQISGLTRPGLPLFLQGRNGRFAWATAPARVDTTDLVILPYSDIDPETYYSAGATIKKIEERVETILVRGDDPVAYTVRFSPWGPIVGQGEKKQFLSLHWTAHEAETLDLGFALLGEAEDLDEAVALARGAALPPLTVWLTDGAGRTVSTETGLRPKRLSMDGSVPLPWAYGDRGWRGWLPAEEIPVTENPPTVAEPDYSGFWFETLARMAGERVPASHASRWDDLQRLVRRASPGSGEARALGNAFARRVEARVLGPLVRRVVMRYPDFNYTGLHPEPLVLRLLAERPAHLLDPRYTSWDDLLLNAADDALEDLPAALNRLDDTVRLAPPGLSGWRLAVLRPWLLQAARSRPDSLGRLEARAYLAANPATPLRVSLPGGLSEHPWSPDFATFHRDWQEGRATAVGADTPKTARQILNP